MENLVFSKYYLLIQKEDMYFIYNSRTNNFYRITSSLAEVIREFSLRESLEGLDEEALLLMRRMKIVVAPGDDEDYYESLKLKHYILSLSSNYMKITLAPTVWCNLKCPYCYETTKPQYKITKEICDRVVQFIDNNTQINSYALTWYGGEPLLCIDEIEYILGQLKSIVGKKRRGHTMVTNGVLLKGKALNVFKEYPLDGVQITLDGNKERHDKIRVRHDGSGTFDTIVHNLIAFSQACPETHITIRVNVDKNNLAQFEEIRTFIQRLLPNKTNIRVYPGILRGVHDCDSKNQFLKNKDVLSFHQEMARKGLPFEIYPQMIHKGCTATDLMSFVIGPKGELYNCWEDMGIPELEIGNIADNRLKEKKIRRYILHGHLFDDPICKNCKILPICYGGCPKLRVANKYEDGNFELCSIYKDNDYEGLKQLLFEYFKNKDKLKLMNDI